jgi:hypothetical protein
MSSRKRFYCLDCGIDTGKIHEHYFINTATWLSVVNSTQGMLCIEHLEKRLGRKLNHLDFPDVSVNNPKYEPKSHRLLKRMNNGKPEGKKDGQEKSRRRRA